MRLFNQHFETLTALVLAGALTGCGGGSTDVDSGLPEDKPANELTEDETETLCDAYADGVSQKLTQVDVCAFAGYFAAALTYSLAGGDVEDLQAGCVAARDACDENPEEAQPEAPECLSGDTVQESCEATVGQLEDCFNDQSDAIAAGMEVPSCESLTIDGLEEYLENAGEQTEPTPACEAVAEDCPDGL